MSVVGTIIECVNCKARTLADGASVSCASCHADLQRDIRELRHTNAVLRAALGEVVWAAHEMLAGGGAAILHAEQCPECGCGGVGPLRDALRKVGDLVPRLPIGGAGNGEST